MADSAKMLVALGNGQPYPPPGVEDTAENRALWDQIKADLADMKARGIKPDVPWEYAD